MPPELVGTKTPIHKCITESHTDSGGVALSFGSEDPGWRRFAKDAVHAADAELSPRTTFGKNGVRIVLPTYTQIQESQVREAKGL